MFLPTIEPASTRQIKPGRLIIFETCAARPHEGLPYIARHLKHGFVVRSQTHVQGATRT